MLILMISQRITQYKPKNNNYTSKYATKYAKIKNVVSYSKESKKKEDNYVDMLTNP